MFVAKNFLTLYHITHRKKPFENIIGNGENAGIQHFCLFPQCFLPYPAPPGWLSGERVGLMTWWL